MAWTLLPLLSLPSCSSAGRSRRWRKLNSGHEPTSDPAVLGHTFYHKRGFSSQGIGPLLYGNAGGFPCWGRFLGLRAPLNCALGTAAMSLPACITLCILFITQFCMMREYDELKMRYISTSSFQSGTAIRKLEELPCWAWNSNL